MPLAERTAARRLVVEQLEDRRMLVAGVTVITHGALLLGGLPDWVTSMGQAVLDRADGAATSRNVGSMFKHDPATGWAPIGADVWTNSNTLADHIVLLYDWTAESAFLEDGWLEAAADNLFASLVKVDAELPGGLRSLSFMDAARTAGGGGGLLDFHFIGHSRGAVLNSLVAERFDRYFGELTIEQVTTLDAHPAGPMNDPGYNANNPSANSRVFTYDNVRFGDNYFQSDGSYEPLTFDFDGVAANGAFNLQLPTPVLENGGSLIEHSDVHSWYYGTITEPFAANYAGFSGAGRNHDGDVAFPDAWWGASAAPPRNATGFAFSRIGGVSRAGLPVTGAAVRAGPIPTVVDGDFAKAVDALFSESLPGWERHGGGGGGQLGGANDLYVELNAGGDDYFRRHNPLYFPKHTTAVQYDYWTRDNDSQPDDVLQVLVGSFVIDTVSLAQTTPGFVRDRRAPYALPQGGVVATLEFRIHDAAGDGIESAVRFDNVELVIQPPTPSADFDDDGDVDGNDFLRWQRGLGTYVVATPAMGDADFDNNVLADDLAVWKASFGKPATSLTTSAEEPASELDVHAIGVEQLRAAGDSPRASTTQIQPLTTSSSSITPSPQCWPAAPKRPTMAQPDAAGALSTLIASEESPRLGRRTLDVQDGVHRQSRWLSLAEFT